MRSQAVVNECTTLVDGNHILHKHHVLDGFGHLSARNPDNPKTFFQTGTAAALIKSPNDFTEYRIDDGVPVDQESSRSPLSPYTEHYIHAAIYANFPEVNCVVHSHAVETLPFGISRSQPLKAATHTAAFLGSSVPVWDIGQAYHPRHATRHLLVNTYDLASSLAAAARKTETAAPSGNYHRVVLQRGHGFVALGGSIPETVYTAIYTVQGAKVLQNALQLGQPDDIHYLTDEEIEQCTKMDIDCIPKVWPLWLQDVRNDPLWH